MYQSLFFVAQKKMKLSQDPIHDLSHVRRVVSLCKNIAKTENMSAKDTEILFIAAWWHDVGRTISNSSSLIFLSLFDDIVSAGFLFFSAIKQKKLTKSVWEAILILSAKTVILHPASSLLGWSKKRKIILQILEDADNLDMISIPRSEQIMTMVKNNQMPKIAYRIAIWWFLTKQTLTFHSKESKKILVTSIEEFIIWIEQPEILLWHETLFTKAWVQEKLTLANSSKNKLLVEISLSYL